MTDAGAINVVTRAGGNQYHADVFYFFRDHNLAAYPALHRDQSNPDPFFQRVRNLVLSADVVYRHFVDVPQNGGSIDVNHFNSGYQRESIVRRDNVDV